MSNFDWKLNIPFRDRDEPVAMVGIHARSLPEPERRIVQALAREALTTHETVGSLLDAIERSSPAQRRALLDRCRQEAGMETATKLDERREQSRIDRRFEDADIPPPPPWSEFQTCHAPRCKAIPVQPNGALVPVGVERWFCAEHEDLAQPGDLDEHEPPYVGISITGRPVPSAKEAARIAAWVAEREAQRERIEGKREEHRRREGEAISAARQRFADSGEISVAGVRVRPDGRLVK